MTKGERNKDKVIKGEKSAKGGDITFEKLKWINQNLSTQIGGASS